MTWGLEDSLRSRFLTFRPLPAPCGVPYQPFSSTSPPNTPSSQTPAIVTGSPGRLPPRPLLRPANGVNAGPAKLCRRKRHPDQHPQLFHFLQQLNTPAHTVSPGGAVSAGSRSVTGFVRPLDTSPQPRYCFLNMDRQSETRAFMISLQPGRKPGCLNPFGPFPLAGERAAFLPKRASAPQATPSPSPMKTADQRPTDTQPTASRDDIGPGIAQPAYRPAADQVNPRGAAPALSVNRSVSAAFS